MFVCMYLYTINVKLLFNKELVYTIMEAEQQTVGVGEPVWFQFMFECLRTENQWYKFLSESWQS